MSRMPCHAGRYFNFVKADPHFGALNINHTISNKVLMHTISNCGEICILLRFHMIINIVLVNHRDSWE